MNVISRLIAAGLLLGVSMSAADLAGIWMGEVKGRNGEMQDVSFQFMSVKGALSGVMFGDEFDLPVQDLNVTGDHVTFSVTTTNYYDGRHVKFIYAGTLTDKSLELTREQPDNENTNADAAKKKRDQRITFTLKRLT
jgi:hypothetical protein